MGTSASSSPSPRVPLFKRWALILPALTVVVFAALCVVGFWQLGGRSPGRVATVDEVSAEVLARYRAESEQLGELRLESRSDLSVNTFLAVFDREAKAGEEPRPLPPRARLVADFEVFAGRGEDGVEELALALLPLWRAELSVEEPDAAELELLGVLFSQCAVRLERSLMLDDAERDSLFALAGAVAERQPDAFGGLVCFLRRAARPSDCAALAALRPKVAVRPQLRSELDKLVASLERGGRDEGRKGWK